MNNLKVVVYVPINSADKIREVIGEAGGGKIGNYEMCSFSSRGIGRFLPKENSNPTIGTIGKLEEVEEERIEFVCSQDLLDSITNKIKENHPYEEVAMDVYQLQN